jgi:predicted GH43/DUF377 family glycosyl hydrolase
MTTQYPIIKRYKINPILTKDDVPYPVATVHNAGIVRHGGRYIMLFRSHCYNDAPSSAGPTATMVFPSLSIPNPFSYLQRTTCLRNMKSSESRT